MDDRHATTIFELSNRILTLKLLPRTGWLQRGMSNVESIAEHTFAVASLAMFIVDLYPQLDRGKILAIAMLHDMAESLVSDLPYSARRFFGSLVKQEAERKAMIELFQGLPQAEEYLDLWAEYTEGRSPEARLVKLLDRMEMLLQALAYERAGSRTMGEFWEMDDTDWSEEFPLVRSIFANMVAARNKLSLMPASA